MEFKCCLAHVDTGIDRFVANEKTFPILTELSEQEKLSTTCEFCEEPATYLVANE
ncbi:CxxH/CxxC protein [Paenisporosarcina cavernae]|uniref:CxxH/CxxC protein n=1 Tax=Paenisporosarcina cavernae TaxID=2320858 RepID=A0A385YRN4_9BACL|nr:CxxH/CxxC protein [Paenisporosarcina cavernae]AYC28408.1 CxxH/CxxC protein [Paenisporosarcina cavernae]